MRGKFRGEDVSRDIFSGVRRRRGVVGLGEVEVARCQEKPVVRRSQVSGEASCQEKPGVRRSQVSGGEEV